MKKFNILLMGALALAFAACDETTPTVPPMQSNPQGPILVDADVNGEPSGVLTAGEVVDLQNYTDVRNIQVYTQTSDSLPAGWAPTFKMELGNDADFTKTKTVDVNMDGNTGYVNVDDLNAAHVALFGRKTDVRDVYYRIAGYASNGGTDYRIGGPDVYFGEGMFKEKCIQAGMVIEDSYYLYSQLCGWEAEKAKDCVFWHSKADVYADPVFTYYLQATPDFYWKVLPPAAVEGNNEEGVLGVKVDGDDASNGELTDANPQAAKIANAGWYSININLEEMTYWIASFSARPYICTPGVSNGWTQANSQWLEFKNDKYNGAIVVKDEFKFSIDNWDQSWGPSDKEGVLAETNENIKLSSGLYWATADIKKLTYTLTPVTSVGVVGALNGWNQTEPIELTANADQSVWEGDVNLDGEWKIVLNHSWDSSYGAGRLTCATFDGGNFNGPNGSYHVIVDFSGNFPMITLQEK